MINIPNYQITKQIYESANSLVYRALRDKDNQAVILKVLKEDYPTPPELTRYRQEYEITQCLADLDGVINVYTLEKHQNTLVMCLEDFGAESLKIWLDEQHTFTLDELLTLAIRATEILGQIHGQNIIHKDINPSNIILNPNTKVLKIIDFGIGTQLAKQHLTLKNPEVLEGTLAYMSPEQTGRINRVLDYRTDFYSLGATFYELFTGKVPFESKDAMELVHCHIAKQPTPPSQINPDLPTIISNLILKLLEKTAEGRYQSAWGIKADLEKVQENLTGLQYRSGLSFELAQNDFSGKFQIPQKLYGREPEIDTLLSAFERVASGTAEIMLIAGYSGIGKSVLVKDIYKLLTEKRGYFIAGKFDQFQRNIPYSAIVNAFKELAQLLLTENETQLTQWKDRILMALGPNGQVIIDVIPEVELIIGAQPAVPKLGPTESQNRFILGFQNFMRAFCQPEHPLVIFLDDLQWVDLATLKLLELVMSDRENTALFLIGAYRDNEIEATHPLITTLNQLRAKNVTINQIILKPLAFEHINQLIAKSLYHNLEAVSSLTDLVMRKTGGNPFFVNQFLQTLYEENLLRFTYPDSNLTGFKNLSGLSRWTWEDSNLTGFKNLSGLSRWTWDLEKIETLNITDNVVQLMIGKLKKLPESAKQVLRLAACVGNRFDLDTLSVIYEKSVPDTFADLMPVLTEGLILPLSEPKLNDGNIYNSQLIIHNSQFLHDRVQQAAYALIDDDQKKAVHLQIGRLLLKNTSIDALEEKVFDIVGQFNLSLELLNNQAELLKVAKLNLMAGQKAKAASAYEAAVNYLETGLKGLSADCWENQYDLTLALYVETVEAEYLNIHFEKAQELSKIVLQQAHSLLEKVRIYEKQIQFYSAQNQLQTAMDTTLQVLEMLGISLSESKPQDVTIDSLSQLPTMTNPYQLAALRILMIVWGTAIIVTPQLVPKMAFTMVNICINYGNSPLSAFSYAFYGFNQCESPEYIEKGYQFGQLALTVLDQFETRDTKCRVHQIFNAFIRHWKEPARHTIEPLRETIQIGLDSGDLEYTCYAAMQYSCYAFLVGEPMDAVNQKHHDSIALIRRLKQEFQLIYAQIWGQLAHNFSNPVADKQQLVGDIFNEIEMLPILKETKSETSLYCLYLAKTMLNYFFKNFADAISNVLRAEEYEPAISVLFPRGQIPFYSSLTLLAIYLTTEPQAQMQYRHKVEANMLRLKMWAKHAPTNYQHKYDLVAAEKARVFGQNWEAAALYEKAIRGAFDNEYIHEEALAYELAGEFYLGHGMEKLAQTYLKEAHYCYQQWGATAIVTHLETRYPQFITTKTATAIPIATIEDTRIVSSSTKKHSELLDLNSIMKAAQTLSGEIVLNRLLEKMMHIVIENAGASSGFLLLPKQDRWFIEAQRYVDSLDTIVLQSLPLEDSEQVSANIIHYVAHSQENVVLHDATQEGNFTRDVYVVKHHPKSVLCVPLVNQGQLTGILYLENNLTVGAFTPERLFVINLLSSQIAISIENSLRTRELEQEIIIRKKAEEAAEAASQAKTAFLTNMTHELRTPLNGILGFAQILQNDSSLTHQQQHGLNIIVQSGNHLLNLINDVLELTKVGIGKIELYETDFNLLSLLSDVSKIVNLWAEDKGIHFYLEFASVLPNVVHGDERRLRQILLKLLDNAIKFTVQGSVTLKVRFNKPNSQFYFKIEDTGIGISPEHLERIFEPFEQVCTQERQAKGTGLGLAISKNLVELMGGQLCVSSEINVGTQFWFELALAVIDYNVAQFTKHAIIGIKGESPKILVVDDNLDNQTVLVDLLSSLGFNVKPANDGREGLEKATQWQPDVIITDLLIPEMEGFELIRQLRQSPVLKNKVIIVTSANTYEKDKQKSLAVGSNAFLPKPIPTETLIEQLQHHLKLTWVCFDKTTAEENHATQMVFPPVAELEKLYEFSLMCDIDELEEQAAILAESSVELKPFVTKMQAFLKNYQLNELGEWLKGKMTDDQ